MNSFFVDFKWLQGFPTQNSIISNKMRPRIYVTCGIFSVEIKGHIVTQKCNVSHLINQS